MLPYQEKLERILESLFVDDVNPDSVKIWSEPNIVWLDGNCCSYSYTDYGA